MNKMSIYNRLPVWGQNLACCCEGSRIRRTRYSKDFWRFLAEYKSRTNRSYEQLCAYRDAKLHDYVQYCYQNVPYYKRLFNEGGINPERIRSLEDLSVVPLMDKRVLMEHQNEIQSIAVPISDRVTVQTSGTTGRSLSLTTTNEAIQQQWAVWWRYRNGLGIQISDWCLHFGGKPIIPKSITDPPFFRYNAPCRQLYFSAFHMNKANMPEYVKEIKISGANWIHGYTSAINLLANYINENNVDLKGQIKHVTIGGENLERKYIDSFRTAFGVTPYQHYGQGEGVATFSENINKQMYIDEDYSAVELIPTEDVDVFEIIGTSLTNLATPLLRYRTGDLVKYRETTRGREIISLDGRKDDYIVLPNGTKIAGILNEIFVEFSGIVEAQFVQNSPQAVELHVVKADSFDETALSKLKNRVTEILPGLSVNVLFVPLIERTEAGKFRFIISNLKK